MAEQVGSPNDGEDDEYLSRKDAKPAKSYFFEFSLQFQLGTP